MKIYFNRRPISGPWGGGSKILSLVIDALISKGHSVTYELFDPGIDIFVCFDPRGNGEFPGFQTIKNVSIHRKKPLVQRVGDLGMHGKPELSKLIDETVVQADHVIFPSYWARDLEIARLKQHGLLLEKCSIIPNVPVDAFFKHRNISFEHHVPLRIVTHHWSTNPLKGFDTYGKFSHFAEKNAGLVEFTYIGRVPENLGTLIKNVVAPLDVDELSRVLPTYDFYLTASIYEAGANHVLEAMAAGLPVLYAKDGGSICEYCLDAGTAYRDFEQLEQLVLLIATTSSYYQTFKQRLLDKKIDDQRALATRYMELFDGIAQY